MRILVVEDDVQMAENFVELLAEAGHEAEVAETAERGLDLVARGTFEGVITDYRPPGRSGVDLLGHPVAVFLAFWRVCTYQYNIVYT